MFKIKLIKNDGSKQYDITPIVSSFKWDSKLSLASSINFNVIKGDVKYIPKNPVELGDLILIYKDNTEVTRGIVVNEKRDEGSTIAYTAFDYAWYLGKSKSVYQFNGITAIKAITKILNDFGMPIGSIIEMGTIISAVYVQKTPAEIIQDIIRQYERQTGVKVYLESRKGKLHIEKMKNALLIGSFKLSDNVAASNVLDNPLGVERTLSIEEMRNRVKIILTESDSYETIALEQDTAMVSKYGLLEETFKIDVADAAKARQVAKILIKRLSKVHETNKITLMGDSAFKAGRLFDVVETVTGMNVRFMITQCEHQVSSGGMHVMDLVLTLEEDVA